jgi:hypothetical protein
MSSDRDLLYGHDEREANTRDGENLKRSQTRAERQHTERHEQDCQSTPQHTTNRPPPSKPMANATIPLTSGKWINEKTSPPGGRVRGRVPSRALRLFRNPFSTAGDRLGFLHG